MVLSANLEGSGDAPHKYAWRFLGKARCRAVAGSAATALITVATA